VRAEDIRNEFLEMRPPVDNSLSKALVESINKSSMDTQKLMEMMIKVISDTNKDPVIQKAPEVKVNFDTRALADALTNQKQVVNEAPIVNFGMEGLEAAIREREIQKDSTSYEFIIKRGSGGQITSVIANPI
jgi:hypothetical protein